MRANGLCVCLVYVVCVCVCVRVCVCDVRFVHVHANGWQPYVAWIIRGVLILGRGVRPNFAVCEHLISYRIIAVAISARIRCFRLANAGGALVRTKETRSGGGEPGK